MLATTIGRKVAAGTQYLADVTISSSGITGWLKDNALPHSYLRRFASKVEPKYAHFASLERDERRQQSKEG